MYIFRGRGVFIDVYQGYDNFATSGATLLPDLDFAKKTYKAIDSVATGRIPSLSCDNSISSQNKEGILPVATLSIALYVSCRSRSDSNVAPEVTKLSSP